MFLRWFWWAATFENHWYLKCSSFWGHLSLCGAWLEASGGQWGCRFCVNVLVWLCTQTFGSQNKKHVGVILQRGVLVLLLCCLPCWALFLNTQLILLLCRQDPAVSRCAGAGRAKSPWEAHPSPCCPLWVSSHSMGAWSGDSPPQHAASAGGRPQPILIEKRHLYGICFRLVPAWARAPQRLRKQWHVHTPHHKQWEQDRTPFLRNYTLCC